jgi:hypothetical protein
LKNGGYIKLFRKLTEWEWYDDANTFRVFIHLLLNASFEANSWQGIALQPGQLITGRKRLAKELKLSERQIRTSLNRLKSTNEIAIKTTNKFSVVTICKWEDYQSEGEAKRPAKRPAKEPTNDQQTTTTKEGKEGKEVLTRDFEKFWTQYDKKKDRKKCFAKWKRLSQSDKEKIFQTLPAYITSTPDKQYRKNPLTYLNGESWNDEIITSSTEQEKADINYLEYSPA